MRENAFFVKAQSLCFGNLNNKELKVIIENLYGELGYGNCECRFNSKGRPGLDARLKSSNKKSSEIVKMSKDFNKEDSATTERVVGKESSTIDLVMEQNRKTLELLQEQQVQNKMLMEKLQLQQSTNFYFSLQGDIPVPLFFLKALKLGLNATIYAKREEEFAIPSEIAVLTSQLRRLHPYAKLKRIHCDI